jgi:release factor glutamine methyltransferase|tara:strand:- start:171 stop:884 length:714 start_codon:yes stop_codon:yes gene_type:complete
MNIDKKFNLISKKINLSKSIFLPNLTSKLSIIAAINNIGKKKHILDLGCGSGIIGIFILNEFKNINLYCSDIQKLAILKAKKNLSKFKKKVEIKQGSLFKPWDKKKFDYIVNDVSGISQKVAKISPWFQNNIPCKTGDDGTRLTAEIIKKSSKHLKKNGCLQFPILSLSNTKKIIRCANNRFKSVKVVKKKAWFLPDKMYKFKSLLYKLKKKNCIEFEEKFGKLICSTSIIVCRDIK